MNELQAQNKSASTETGKWRPRSQWLL